MNQPIARDYARAFEPRGRRWRTVRLAAGALVAVSAFHAAARTIEWHQVAAAFADARLSWIGAAVGSVLVTLGLVTERWGLLVGEAKAAATRARAAPARSRRGVLWDSLVLGQAVNIVVPLRFGEGVRLAVTSRGLELPIGQVIMGLALERAFDVVAFATMVVVLISSGWMPPSFQGLMPAAVTLVVATLAAVMLCVRLLLPVFGWLHASRFQILAPAAEWIQQQDAAIRDGWVDLTQRRQLGKIALLTAVIPIAAAATNYLVLRSFDLPVPAIAALVLLVVLQIGTAVVSVPGNVGVFHYLTVVTLAAWDVPPPTAVAVALVLHIVSLGPKVVLGAFSLRSYF